jgi:hypothetical protein
MDTEITLSVAKPALTSGGTLGTPRPSTHAPNPTNTGQQVKNLRTTLVVGFAANIILFVGYMCNLAFSVFELEGRDRESVAVCLYFLAFAFLILSGLVELGLDIFSTE